MRDMRGAIQKQTSDVAEASQLSMVLVLSRILSDMLLPFPR